MFVCVSGTHVKSPCTTEGQRGVCEECELGTFTEHSNGLKQCFKCTRCRSGNSTWHFCTIDWNDCRRVEEESIPNLLFSKLSLTEIFSLLFRSGSSEAMWFHWRYPVSVQIRAILCSWRSMWSVQEMFKVTRCKLKGLVHSSFGIGKQIFFSCL